MTDAKNIKGKRGAKKESRKIDVRTANVLSFFPGIGHIYVGDFFKGAETLFLYLFLLWVFLSPDHYPQPPPAFVLVLVWLILTSIFWFFNVREVRKMARGTT
jgi:hypothetical protein